MTTSSHPTDWDIDDYRTEHESDEHWQLRKSFMERWKDNFPEDRIVCLARVFANIEFLGCRYPPDVMKLVAELSKEVAIDYREKKKKKLQRTFVSASDAAEDRAKGTKRPHIELTKSDTATSDSPRVIKKLFVAATTDSTDPSETVNATPDNFSMVGSLNMPTRFNHLGPISNNIPIHHNKSPSSMASSAYTQSPASSNTGSISYGRNADTRFNNNRRNKSGWNNDDSQSMGGFRNINRKRSHWEQEDLQMQHPLNNLIASKYGNLVLFDNNLNHDISRLLNSCQRCKVPLNFEFDHGENNDWMCHVMVNGLNAGNSSRNSQKEAKEAAAKMAWETLSQLCYTVVVKQSHASKEDKKISATEVQPDEDRQRLDEGLGTKVDSAIATRMMKLMGWGGGALGAASDGISEPIAPNLKQIHRAGLGKESSGRSVMQSLERTMQNYKQSASADHDLVFATDFTKEERALMHKMALRLGLKSKSFGKDPDRYLVISKVVTPLQLVQSLLQSGCSNDKHELLKPSQKRIMTQ